MLFCNFLKRTWIYKNLQKKKSVLISLIVFCLSIKSVAMAFYKSTDLIRICSLVQFDVDSFLICLARINYIKNFLL